ncbi:MAG: cysteine hydrolase [Chloroflexota bacterium]|nr:cysteine hydrolase [Chloroflexota bacterium]
MGEMGRVLLVVDVQQGFVNPFTDHVPGRIRRLIERGDHDPVLFTRFINRPDGPYRRFLGWHECAEPPGTDLAPEVAPLAATERVFTKRGFTGISEGLADRLRELAPEAVTIVGIDTDMCVLKVAMDIFDLGIRPLVLVDCCASTAGLQAHLAGLAVLARNIGADQLREAGLSDGFLGSPPDEATEEGR